MHCSGCSCHLALIVSARLHRAQRRAKLQLQLHLQPRVSYLELGSFNLLSGQTRLSTLCRKLNHKKNNATAAASFQKYALYQREREREGDKTKKNTAQFVREKSQYFSVTSCCCSAADPPCSNTHVWLTDQNSFNFVYFTFSLLLRTPSLPSCSPSLSLTIVKWSVVRQVPQLSCLYLSYRGGVGRWVGERQEARLSPNLAIVSANRWNRARNFGFIVIVALVVFVVASRAWFMANNLNNFIYIYVYIYHFCRCLCNVNCFACHFVASCCCCLVPAHW